jgi:hypothetical protein
LGVPVPVQTFLWGQIAPFIRPKLGKLHEASCTVSKQKNPFFLIHNIYTNPGQSNHSRTIFVRDPGTLTKKIPGTCGTKRSRRVWFALH